MGMSLYLCKMKRVFTTIILLFLLGVAYAQHQELFEKPTMYKGAQQVPEDTTSVLSAFKRGRFSGHFRYFFMSTQNADGLSDYYANAAGGGLRYETAPFHHFQFAVSGFYTFNIGSSDLGKTDAATGMLNRYEIALFDIEDAYNKKDNDRLEELYLKYHFKKVHIIFGKQLINTPFVNLQDGRMRPTGVEGVWVAVNAIKQVQIEGGWLYAISPRATTKWFDVGESIGIYSVGIDATGSKSQYATNLESKGVLLLGTHIQAGKQLQLHGWNLFTQNIFNTALLQADWSLPQKHGQSLFASAQFIRQDAVSNGGNDDAAKAYMEKGSKAMTFGARLGWKNQRWEASLNYNRITAHGRYLMPREWGREPFFTFLPRERNEGFGDLHALMAKVNYNIPKARIKTALATGYYQLPDVKNYRLNKYGLPSYLQANADFRYAFAKMLNGLEAQVLIVGKWNKGETYGSPKYTFNKVNMANINLVLNYHF